MKQYLQTELQNIQDAGLYKNERIIVTPQSAAIKLADGSDVLNFCANNYLGLSDNPRIIEAAKRAMDERGYGMSSVRFICGTRTSTRNSKRLSPNISAPKILFSTPAASMPMAVCSSPSWVRKMPSSPTLSTMPASSTVYVSAKPSVIVMPMPTWPTLSAACRKHRNSVSVSSAPMVSSLWMAM